MCRSRIESMVTVVRHMSVSELFDQDVQGYLDDGWVPYQQVTVTTDGYLILVMAKERASCKCSL